MVMDIGWEQRGGHAVAILTAAAPLAEGTLLCPALWLEGLPWEELLVQWGLVHLDCSFEGERFCPDLLVTSRVGRAVRSMRARPRTRHPLLLLCRFW